VLVGFALQAIYFGAQSHLQSGGDHALPRPPFVPNISGRHMGAKERISHCAEVAPIQFPTITQCGYKPILYERYVCVD
jgi:hypothetical protein